MRSIVGVVALATVMSAVAMKPANAQRVTDARMAATSLPFTGTVHQQAQDRKEPALAGVVSFLVPGVGSFYAGNSRHGAVHLGIHVASFVVYIVGLASAVDEIDPNTGTLNEGSFAVAGVGLLALLVNNVWSIFTAIGDANAYNAKTGGRPGRVVGELYLSPEVKNLRDVQLAPSSTETDKRVGVQLLKLQF